ncbi:carboxypeptidase-like regulatory domain-containing protein [Seonamhaeicola marinus]|uniref:Carboxypeptidase-like regulatory domain-containing protein n=1 Tax=Seonamhaeicola marinus TaxID=1912246 RepID=A0A5D0HYD0_9FLAO|nr:carboxypeptidase-like regulatory domain-containing protein [Seonamhaeicola marinus]TYA74472.1 carboxypeptidase-like regulatory domain-containing protein [Seonamhaeicola marinus]
MKYLATLVFILITSISFAQDSGLIVGKVLDKELDNTPLAFANISIKGTEISSTSDLSGTFLFENLKDGKYTLVCNFPGYESKEIEIQVSSFEPAEIKLALNTFKLPEIETASK